MSLVPSLMLILSLVGLYRLDPLKHRDYANPRCCTVHIASGLEICNSLRCLRFGIRAVAFDHRGSRAPDVLFGKHAARLAPAG